MCDGGGGGQSDRWLTHLVLLATRALKACARATDVNREGARATLWRGRLDLRRALSWPAGVVARPTRRLGMSGSKGVVEVRTDEMTQRGLYCEGD